MLSDRIKTFGYQDPNAFWAELESAATPYLVLLDRYAALQAKLQRASRLERQAIARDLEMSHIPLCRARADALAAARGHFGRDTFDRFLYTVVAPQSHAPTKLAVWRTFKEAADERSHLDRAI